MPDGRFRLCLRRIVFALSMGCLIAAAGMMIVWLAKQSQETARRNAEKEAAGQNVASEQGLIEHDGPMTIRSQRQSAEHGMQLLRRQRADRIATAAGSSASTCNARPIGPGGPIRLAGYGGVVVRGIARFPRLKADNFVFDSRDGGLLTLAGEVQVEGPDGLQKYRLCAIALKPDGRIVKAKSLLDDFAESQSMVRKLALLDDITAVYSDDELPPDATWLLAMKLLERHLTWHGGQADGGRGAGAGRWSGGKKAERADATVPESVSIRPSGPRPTPANRGCGKAWRKGVLAAERTAARGCPAGGKTAGRPGLMGG